MSSADAPSAAAAITILSEPPPAPATLAVPDLPSSTSAPSLQVPDSSPSEATPAPAALAVPDLPSSTSAPSPHVPDPPPSEATPASAALTVPDLPSSTSAPSLHVPDSSREATTTPSNDNSLLSFEAASHAERNPGGITQTSRTLKKLTDAQKATRKIRQETERCAQELLSNDLDELLTRHREELMELAERHGKKVEAIDKLMTSGHYKHKRSVNIENAKIHMKSQEVNAGKSSSSPVHAISMLSIFINRSKHGGPSTTA